MLYDKMLLIILSIMLTFKHFVRIHFQHTNVKGYILNMRSI